MCHFCIRRAREGRLPLESDPMQNLARRLREIYLRALYRSDPALLTQQALERDEVAESLGEPLTVLCLGKCASGMFKGAAAVSSIVEGFAAYPEGYLQDPFPPFVEVVHGDHPRLTPASFEAGEALVKFARRGGAHQVLVLLSGGTSATVDLPLEPWFSGEDLAHVNDVLLHAGLPIESMNTVRKHLSAVKGGRLGAMLPAGTVTLVLSDVSRGNWHDVGSGPTLPDTSSNAGAAELLRALGDDRCRHIASILESGEVPDTPERLEGHHAFLIGDNQTLVNKAAEIASLVDFRAHALEEELNGDVEATTEHLFEELMALSPGELVVAGGEPTVRVTHPGGRGGRCSELAVRLGERLRRTGKQGCAALLASSDGVDGDTDASGFIVISELYQRAPLTEAEVRDVLERSDTFSVVGHYAEALEKRPTGNNLRDIFILARS
jgi:glycerate 2-kinase